MTGLYRNQQLKNERIYLDRSHPTLDLLEADNAKCVRVVAFPQVGGPSEVTVTDVLRVGGVDMRPIVALLVFALVIISCRSRSSIDVAVVYTTMWKLRGATLSENDTLAVRRAALATLRRAFDGFAVHFVEAPKSHRTIRVEDTPYAPNARERLLAAGLTYPLSTTSFVRIDVLFNNELAAAHCTDLGHCQETRTEMIEGLGRGVGATAAHELGHQLGFIVDTDCDACYDSRAATSYAHFFGEQHWSDRVVPRMSHVLPRE